MKSGLSLNPYKKAAVTSKSITLNFFPDDLRVAALKLLAIDSPGVPGNRVSLANSRATRRAFWFGTLYRSLVRDDPFGRQHHGLWIEFRLAPVHHFIQASLREFLQLDLLCFRDLVFSSGGTCLHTLYDHHGVQLTSHSLCAPVKWESAEFCFPEDDRHITALIKPSVSDLSFDVCSGRPRSP